MARSTKLYQQPGSPLIQGHSRAERPSWGEWLRGVVVCVVVAFGVFIYLDLDPNTPFGVDTVLDAARSAVLLFLPGALIGSALGVPVARGFGWRRLWLSAACLGGLGGALSVWGLHALGL